MKYIMILGLLILLVGCSDSASRSIEYPNEIYCMKHLDSLSCEQLLECYDACDKQELHNWKNECREGYKPRLWKCYSNYED